MRNTKLILCAAAFAGICSFAVAQADDSTGVLPFGLAPLDQTSPLNTSTPQLGASVVQSGWILSVSNTLPNKLVLLVLGIDPVPNSPLDLGEFGTVLVGVSYPAIGAVLGPTSSTGSLSFPLVRPQSIPPELIGRVIPVQMVTLDYVVEQGGTPDAPIPLYFPTFFPSNVVGLVL